MTTVIRRGHSPQREAEEVALPRECDGEATPQREGGFARAEEGELHRSRWTECRGDGFQRKPSLRPIESRQCQLELGPVGSRESVPRPSLIDFQLVRAGPEARVGVEPDEYGGVARFRGEDVERHLASDAFQDRKAGQQVRPRRLAHLLPGTNRPLLSSPRGCLSRSTEWSVPRTPAAASV